MKYRNFITKVLCFLLVFAAFVPYQAKASKKAEEEAENAAKIAEVEAANREVRKQMAEAENASPYTDGVYEGTAEGFGFYPVPDRVYAPDEPPEVIREESPYE